MSKNIAVCLGEDGNTATLFDKGKLVVYTKSAGKWESVREMEHHIDRSLGMVQLRLRMKEILNFLNGCQVFAGLSVTGVPYFELEKQKISIWEFSEKPAEFLDYILEKEEEAEIENAATQKKDNIIQMTPVEIAAGCYRISIKEIQEKNTGITSKQVLLPFLRKSAFYSLEIICNHIPPWLEAEMIVGKLEGNIARTGENEHTVVLSKKCCPV
ncbi:hypothetical protein Dtox_1032 [Desulfofarcimen acetoxidans DSM 771]|jgi:Fe-only nitrogenase accessory protein AnfO|uniref:Nitrogenase iron-iron accessory protein AnfO n=1 Tax=Desulfofarcimen acetoxidans (strain ATCC 49208 / DSM 771 / KCTC 5769 / VKM B-1644 / 5575) TaxID=485916 RepID=C8W450_DESAS|nr:Fe-only nitrogenase accessory AnfO family protein [Desulfofarcimen acetoxidans]ACV61918.1 hypothetical protein Dtox_1032 [Desulfofarcimen acetoxidans DSM 771]